jgi:hypothetical protein
MTPFTIIDKLTGPYAFSKTSRDTLGDKMELYFHDFSFVPLFMQVSRFEPHLSSPPRRIVAEKRKLLIARRSIISRPHRAP